jgi:hypothetical protein
VLGHRSHNSERQRVGLGQVQRHELHRAVLQRVQESRITAQAVQFGDNEGGARLPAAKQRLGQLRPVTVLAGLRFPVGARAHTAVLG